MRPGATLRKQAMAALRNWRAEIESMGVSTTHPLASVRDFHLDDRLRAGSGRVYAVETRPTSRSRIPIKEISAEAQSVHDWMKDVERADPVAHAAAMAWLVKPDFDVIADALRCSRTKAINKFDRALMVIEVELMRLTGGITRE